jgi:hypothetical protein
MRRSPPLAPIVPATASTVTIFRRPNLAPLGSLERKRVREAEDQVGPTNLSLTGGAHINLMLC